MKIESKLLMGVFLLGTINSSVFATDSGTYGEICFANSPNATQVWYMKFDRALGKKSLYDVSGFVTGTTGNVGSVFVDPAPSDIYYTGLNGTAIIAAQTNDINTLNTLHISLKGAGTGNGNAVSPVPPSPATILFDNTYVLDLDTVTFLGTLTGTEVSTQISPTVLPPAAATVTTGLNLLTMQIVTCPKAVTSILGKGIYKTGEPTDDDSGDDNSGDDSSGDDHSGDDHSGDDHSGK